MNRILHSSFLSLFVIAVLTSVVQAETSLERINCKKPGSQAHKLICGDPFLRQMAVQLGLSYGDLTIRLFESARRALNTEQQAWTVFRDSDCDTAFNKPFKGPQKKPKRICLTGHFEQRLVTLEQRLSSTGQVKHTTRANLSKASELMPKGLYRVTAKHQTSQDQGSPPPLAADTLIISNRRIVWGDKFCIEPAFKLAGIENYFFFRNNFDTVDPGFFGWSNRSRARSLVVSISCGAGDLGLASTILIGKPGVLGLIANKETFLILEKN